jgi:hypothetical protein
MVSQIDTLQSIQFVNRNSIDIGSQIDYTLSQYITDVKRVLTGDPDTPNSSNSLEIVNWHEIDTQVSEYVDNSIQCNGSTYSIATLVFFFYNRVYTVSKLKSKAWYVFDGYRWRPSEVGPYYELSSDIVAVYEYHAKKLLDKIDIAKALLTTGKMQLSTVLYLSDKVERCNKIIDKLKNVSSKENICKECVYLFYDETFSKKMDTNPHLVCFNNGVLDMQTNKFRNAIPFDNITIMIGIDYVHPHSNKDRHKFNKLMEDFQVFRADIVNRRKGRLTFTPF